jgi:hypothetical protein
MDRSSLPFLFLTDDSPFATGNEFHFLKVLQFSDPPAGVVEILDPARPKREKGFLLIGERAKLHGGILSGKPELLMRGKVTRVSP